ncbi:MAG: hypothetical protein RL538_370 [Candidatus Parcubacteria bacterium]
MFHIFLYYVEMGDGHESLTIIVHYVPILVSVRDPVSAVFISRKGNENMPPTLISQRNSAQALLLHLHFVKLKPTLLWVLILLVEMGGNEPPSE